MNLEAKREDGDWSENELGCVELGDKCLRSRLVMLARPLAMAPNALLPQALSSWRDLKAAYHA